MKVLTDIPLFQCGMNKNNCYISEDVARKSMKDFINKPIIVYNEDYEANVIGIVSKVNNYKDNYVYGDLILLKDEYNIGNFFNYEIIVEESHEENGINYIDDFKLNALVSMS